MDSRWGGRTYNKHMPLCMQLQRRDDIVSRQLPGGTEEDWGVEEDSQSTVEPQFEDGTIEERRGQGRSGGETANRGTG